MLLQTALPEKVKLEDLMEDLKNYAVTNYTILKLETAERTAVIGSGMISSLVVLSVMMLFILFFSLAAAFYLSALLGNTYAGLLIVAGFYLLAGTILWFGRKKLLEHPLRERLIRKLFRPPFIDQHSAKQPA